MTGELIINWIEDLTGLLLGSCPLLQYVGFYRSAFCLNYRAVILHQFTTASSIFYNIYMKKNFISSVGKMLLRQVQVKRNPQGDKSKKRIKNPDEQMESAEQEVKQQAAPPQSATGEHHGESENLSGRERRWRAWDSERSDSTGR